MGMASKVFKFYIKGLENSELNSSVIGRFKSTC